jgi:hypothetical protein
MHGDRYVQIVKDGYCYTTLFTRSPDKVVTNFVQCLAASNFLLRDFVLQRIAQPDNFLKISIRILFTISFVIGFLASETVNRCRNDTTYYNLLISNFIKN